MRVIHLSNSDFRGAAARGVSALHSQLRARGIDSRLFAGECFTETTEQMAPAESIALAKFTQNAYFDQNFGHELASGFTLGCPGKGKLHPQLLENADIIHLHDVKGLCSPRTINALLETGKPVLWTLSDMWAFTGGCHASMECDNYRGDCSDCPQLRQDPLGILPALLGEKRSYFDVPNLHVAAHTEWLAARAAGSGVFGNAPVRRTSPVLGELLPLPKQEAKAQLGLDPDVFTLLILCENTGREERYSKGIRRLLESCALFHVLPRMARKNKVRIVVLGSGCEQLKLDLGVMLVATAGDYKNYSLLLSAADLAVLPNVEENSGQIVMEAAICGTPAIAMNGGGSEEWIKDGGTGRLVPVGDLRRMAEEISYLALHPELTRSWGNKCRETFMGSSTDAVEQHLELYRALLAAGRENCREHKGLRVLDAQEECADLVPLLWNMLETSISISVETAHASTASVLAHREKLKKALVMTADKLAFAEKRIHAGLAGRANPKIESSLLSLNKLRKHLMRALNEEQSGDEERHVHGSSHRKMCEANADLRTRWTGPKERIMRWAHKAYFGKGHTARPGVLKQHAPRSVVLETFPRPRVAPRKLPSIAMVTPSYMQGRFIETTLRSVVEQGYPKLRYAVQDAGSTDETLEVLRRYSSRITSWVSEADTGQARAVASGFERISGDIMAWLNSDDLLMPGALHFVGEYFLRHPEVDAIYGHRVIIDENDQEIGRWVLPPHDPEVLLSVDYVPQETLFWRKSLWKKVGGISPKFRFALDWDLLLRFQHAGARIIRVPYYLGLFRVHTLQKTSAQMETIGNQEVNHLRKITPGALTDPEQLGQVTKKVIRGSALCAWLLRHGIRW